MLSPWHASRTGGQSPPFSGRLPFPDPACTRTDSEMREALLPGWESTGGLLGTHNGTVVNSYSLGNVTGNSHVGGLVGYSEGTVSNSFWNTETSGQATSDGGTGKTTAQMQNIITFSGATWNITAVANPSLRNPAYIWNIINNTTYPFLSWQP